MSKLLKILLFFVIVFSSETGKSQNQLWTDGTAFIAPYKSMELCLFRPARYAFAKKAELAAHPLAFFVFPHLFLKKKWTEIEIFKKKLHISTRHGLYYPAFVFNITRNFEHELLLPADTSNIFYVFGFQNELIISHLMDEQTQCKRADKIITGRLGLKYAFKNSESVTPVVLQSVLFRETMVFSPEFVWYLGLRFDARLNNTFNYFADLNFYSVGLAVDYFSVESKAGIMGYSGERLKGFAGIKTGFSTISDKNRFLIIPIAGFSYTFPVKSKKGKELGLFGRKMFKHKDTSIEGEIKYMDEDWKSRKDSIPPKKTDPDFK